MQPWQRQRNSRAPRVQPSLFGEKIARTRVRVRCNCGPERPLVVTITAALQPQPPFNLSRSRPTPPNRSQRRRLLRCDGVGGG